VYPPNEGVLDGMTREQREQLFVESLSRARKPQIYQVWIDDASYGYDSTRTLRDGFGVPVGYTGQRRVVYFANVRELRLYDNHAIFVIDTSGRLVDKVQFAYRDDAERMIDLIAAYRAQRLAGQASPGPRYRSGPPYPRPYRRRGHEPPEEGPPPYDPRDDEYDRFERYDDGPRD
jgi:hypothetical protein